jgi:GTP-binding protein HflX
MFEKFSLPSHINAITVSLVCPSFEGHKTHEQTQHSLSELYELLRTLDIQSVDSVVQAKKKLDAATIIGIGKLKEIKELAELKEAKILVFDVDLTATQVRNIQELTGLQVIDRCQVILEIFAKHAHTSEAKTQIEISRLQYLLPRLSVLWTHFSRQKGGVGIRGGEGEQQIELDRRMVRDRIEFYKKQLKEVTVSREEQKKKRKDNVICAALVGYTNAGKSSIMNRLCSENVREEDKLFATLDATYRTLSPDAKPPLILIDTVGFISNLPSTLINGFKSTLESAVEAELLIIVCDASDPYVTKHIEVTLQTLKELKLQDKEKIYVFTKKDLVKNELLLKVLVSSYNPHFIVSTYDTNDMTNLRQFIIDQLLSKLERYDLFIPYTEGSLHSLLQAKTNIIHTANHQDGIYYQIRIAPYLIQKLNLTSFLLPPNDSLVYESSASVK